MGVLYLEVRFVVLLAVDGTTRVTFWYGMWWEDGMFVLVSAF